MRYCESGYRILAPLGGLTLHQNNVQVFQTLVNFLRENGNRQAILSETGGGNTESCFTLYVSSSLDVIWSTNNMQFIDSRKNFALFEIASQHLPDTLCECNSLRGRAFELSSAHGHISDGLQAHLIRHT